MTNEEEAEELRPKLESMHRQALMEFASKIRQECAEKVMFITGRKIGNSFYLSFDAVIAAILGTAHAPKGEEMRGYLKW
jgi:hypothetical protein